MHRSNRTSYNDTIEHEDHNTPIQHLLINTQANDDDPVGLRVNVNVFRNSTFHASVTVFMILRVQIYQPTTVISKPMRSPHTVSWMRPSSWLRGIPSLFRRSNMSTNIRRHLSNERHTSGQSHTSGRGEELKTLCSNNCIPLITTTSDAPGIAVPYETAYVQQLTMTCNNSHNNSSLVTSTTGVSFDKTQSASLTELTVSEGVDVCSLVRDGHHRSDDGYSTNKKVI